MNSEDEMEENIALLASDLDLAVIDGLIEQVNAGIDVIRHRPCVDLDLVEQAHRFMRKLDAYRTKQF